MPIHQLGNLFVRRPAGAITDSHQGSAGFVNMAFTDGAFTGSLAYALPSAKDVADSRRADLLVPQSAATSSERATDSAIERIVAMTTSSISDGLEHTVRHTVDDIDELWSVLGESWNSLAGQAAA